MPLPDLRYTPGKVPDGYHAVPITAAQAAAPLRVCTLVKPAGTTAGVNATGAPSTGGLVLLRSHIDARVYLGCVVDAAGYLHDWAEVWVQSTEGLVDSIPAYRDALSNHAMDQRWLSQVRAYERFERPILIHTGFEGRSGTNSRPPVTFIDAGPQPSPVHPIDQHSGEPWVLCEDDAVLIAAGLPPYSTTLHRYLYLPEKGTESNFVAASSGSPANARTRPLADLFPGRPPLLAFNPGAGLLLVRRAGPLSYSAYLDVVSGVRPANTEAVGGVAHGRSTVGTGLALGAAGSAHADTVAWAEDAGLFLGQQGKWGRLIETLHLKVRAVADSIAAVRAITESSQRPVLNLSPESFQVHLSDPARGLPHVWSARVSLVDPGDAIALAIKASDAQHYISPTAGALSIFRPTGAGTATRGVATLRIRQILNPSADSLVLEGTLSTDQRVLAQPTDLVWVRLSLGGGTAGAATGGRIDLYGRLESDAALAGGEWRFRTIGQRFSPADVALIQSATGVPLSGSHFEIIPLVATPVDLYALAVLGAKTLLTDSKTSLPVVLDELLSLARQVAHEYDASVSLTKRVGAIFARDGRWLEALGPHRLSADPIQPTEAFDLVPAALWWETLAALVRMFPGVGPDSSSRGLGDAPFGGMHLVFDQAMEDFDRIVRQTRSLIVIDWNYNREIHAVVRQYAAGVGGAGGSGAGGTANR